MTATKVRGFLSAAIVTSLAFGFVIACSGPDKGELERKVSTRASPGSFRSAGVSTVLEKRCGSLDCHGTIGRNLRIYSSGGLRLPNEAGLKPGNRLFVIRKGDAWHRTQTTGSSAKRIALEDESPAATETVPKPRDSSTLPEEVLAELRVINVRKNTAMCIVTASQHEIEAGDRAFARKGF